MKFVQEFMERNISEGASNIVLHGNHGEQAVFIIDSPSHSVHSQDHEGNQVFVYHRTLAEERNALIAGKMKEELFGTDEAITKEHIAQLLNKIMFKHLQATA